jgi:hypothetical protein
MISTHIFIIAAVMWSFVALAYLAIKACQLFLESEERAFNRWLDEIHDEFNPRDEDK